MSGHEVKNLKDMKECLDSAKLRKQRMEYHILVATSMEEKKNFYAQFTAMNQHIHFIRSAIHNARRNLRKKVSNKSN